MSFFTQPLDLTSIFARAHTPSSVPTPVLPSMTPKDHGRSSTAPVPSQARLSQTPFLSLGSSSPTSPLVSHAKRATSSLRTSTLPSLQLTSNPPHSDYIPFDGLLGLARQAISRQKVPTLLDTLVNAGKLKHPIVSYHIPRFADGKDNNHGELTLGALNPAKYDPKTLVTVPNVSPLGFWEAKLQDVIVNGKKLGWTNRTAIFDTGTVRQSLCPSLADNS